MNKTDIVRPASKSPLPADAKRVFKGEIFDVYQWQQKLFDGSYATFEKLKRPDTVVVIPVTAEGKIIVLEQEQPNKKPFLGFAGGRVNKGEGILEAAKRELKEETGYEAGELVLIDAVQPHSKIEWAVYTFVAKECVKTGELQLDAGERISFKLISFDEMLKLVLQGELLDREWDYLIMDRVLNKGKADSLRKMWGLE